MGQWRIPADIGIITFNHNGPRFHHKTAAREGATTLPRRHSPKKKFCECGHAKGFHRSANKPPKHGRTPCGFPECDCQSYKPKTP